MQRSLLLMSVFAVLAAGVAQGKECKGVSFPDQAQIEGSTLSLNGLGLRQATMLKVNVCVAALYVTKASSDPNAILGANAPYQLILQLVRDVGASDGQQGMGRGLREKRQGFATRLEGPHRYAQRLDERCEDRRAPYLLV